MSAATVPPADTPWSSILFGIAALIVLVQAWRGWRAGVIRQLVSIFALALACVAAIYGRGLVVPLLRPLGLPDRQLSFVAGAALALGIYAAILILSAIVFKNTSQQKVGIVRVGYGLLGGLVGAVRGLVIVWMLFVILRLFGVLAEVRLEIAKHPLSAKVRARLPRGAEPAAPGRGVKSIADMKSALDDSPVGGLLDRFDPIPRSVQRVLPKTISLLSDENAARRLQDYPGMDALVNHPKLVELQRDPEVSKAIADHNYLALFRNAHVQQALTDPEFTAALRKFDYEKALDYALATPEKKPAPPLDR